MRGGPAELAYGPVLIGLVFNLLLFGIMMAQCYIYFTTYKKDRAWIKLLIIVLLLLDILNTVLYTYFVYDGVIIHFGDVLYIEHVTWYLLGATIAMGVIEIAVQIFYAWRIHVLIQNWFLTLFVIALSLTGGACSWVACRNAIVTPIYTKFQDWEGVVMTWLGCACAADIVISVSLVWHLNSHKTGFKNSDLIIDRIIRVTVQTGLITTIVAIVNIAVFASDPTGTHLIFNVTLSKLYSNSLLSSLNSRGGWKFNQLSTVESGSHPAAHDVSTFRAETTSTFLNLNHGGAAASQTAPRKPGLFKAFTPKAMVAQHQPEKPEIFVHVESHEMQDVMRPSNSSSIVKDIEVGGDASSVGYSLESRYSAKRRDYV